RLPASARRSPSSNVLRNQNDRTHHRPYAGKGPDRKEANSAQRPPRPRSLLMDHHERGHLIGERRDVLFKRAEGFGAGDLGGNGLLLFVFDLMDRGPDMRRVLFQPIGSDLQRRDPLAHPGQLIQVARIGPVDAVLRHICLHRHDSAIVRAIIFGTLLLCCRWSGAASVTGWRRPALLAHPRARCYDSAFWGGNRVADVIPISSALRELGAKDELAHWRQ